MTDIGDEFGDRMKAYEHVQTSRKLDAHLPIYARIDGRAFHTFTRGMKKPFDADITDAMIETTKFLVDRTYAKIGYTQSDEISLIWQASGENSSVFFDGKVLKMASILASLTTAKFILSIPEKYQDRFPHFDARVLQLPNREEAANALLWRAMDARKNSIAMVAQANFSHKQLQGKGRQEMISMLAEIGVDFESYEDKFKNGTFVKRVTSEIWLSDEELEKIPVAHRPSGPVMRSKIVEIPMPLFNKVSNRVGVIFDNEEPKCG